MALFGRKKTAEHSDSPVAVNEVVSAPAPTISHRSVEAQRTFLLDRIGAMRPFGMKIHDVSGLTLCEDITSDLDLPLVTTARVSGYGVRGSDLVGASPEHPRSVFVVDSIDAGQEPGAPLVAGAAVLVEEGAIVPEGVDAVVAAHLGDLGADGYVRIVAESRLYENLRRAGSELADGTPLLRAGEVLTPRSVAVLAEVGIDKVLVRPRPRIVVLTLGDGLVAPGQPLTAPFQCYDSATAVVAAAARADGSTVFSLGIVAGDVATLRETISDQQIRADLIIVIGGGDLVREVADGMGEFDDAIVALNGQSRFGFAALGHERTPMIVLPSGVVSAYVGYQAFVRPVINRLNEADPLSGTRVEGRLADQLDGAEGTTQYLPGVRDAAGVVRVVGAPDSELAWDLARANVLVIIPSSWAGADAGSTVECIVLDDAHGQGRDSRP